MYLQVLDKAYDPGINAAPYPDTAYALNGSSSLGILKKIFKSKKHQKVKLWEKLIFNVLLLSYSSLIFYGEGPNPNPVP